MSGNPKTPTRRGNKRQKDEDPEDENQHVKLQKRCKKCLQPIKGHPLPTGDACKQQAEMSSEEKHQILENREEKGRDRLKTNQKDSRRRRSKAQIEDDKCKDKLRKAAARLKLKKKLPTKSYIAWCDPEDDQKPKVETLIIPKMDEVCVDCGALMFPFETKKQKEGGFSFSLCCSYGK